MIWIDSLTPDVGADAATRLRWRARLRDLPDLPGG
jgi:hypothetical protein